MTETTIVCLIVIVALLLTGRSIHRSLTGRSPRCSCGQPGVCPLSDAERKRQCDSDTGKDSQPRPRDGRD
ncbi:MAG: hypothetical protein AB1696_08165 [Planctomycetota bacterium]